MASQRVGAKHRPMAGSAKQSGICQNLEAIQNLIVKTVWIASSLTLPRNEGTYKRPYR
jgi:hypothetical protein